MSEGGPRQDSPLTFFALRKIKRDAMGEVIDFRAFRQKKQGGAKFVHCGYCGERHPVVRLANGEETCPTAFFDAGLWFCRNRGCRSAYFARGNPRR